jgi:hypothetical protein
MDFAMVPEKLAMQYLIGREGGDGKLVVRGIFEKPPPVEQWLLIIYGNVLSEYSRF